VGSEMCIRDRRVYDLTERVLPKGVDTTLPTGGDEKRFFVKRALGALGVATIQDVNRYISISGRLDKWVAELSKTGEIVEVEIEGLRKPYYVLGNNLQSLRRGRSAVNGRVYLLSPFDNSVILRDRTEALFDFKYSLECYVPKHKRKYGYFSLPILWCNQLVGRLDPKADRQRKVLLINSIHLEKSIDAYTTFLSALARTLNNFAAFNACEHIELNKNIHKKVVRRLSPYLV
jgi:uncharacterized protein YcaQ